MYTIRLANEFLHGPIWVYDEQGFIRGNFPLVTDDAELNRMNSEAPELHDSFYSDDCRDYDEAGYKAAYPKMKEIINKIGSIIFSVWPGTQTSAFSDLKIA